MENKLMKKTGDKPLSPLLSLLFNYAGTRVWEVITIFL
jgi:hypothetical protein